MAKLQVTGHTFHCAEEFAFPGAYITKSYALPFAASKAIECPYCHIPLYVIRAVQIARVKAVLECRPDGEFNLLADMIPETHTVLGCEECENFFTLPQEGYCG